MNYPSANEVNVALLVMGVLVTTLGLFSAFLKAQLLLTEPIAALGVGVLLGPAVLNWVDLTHWGNPDGILEQGARGAIAIQLMALALERGGACDLNSGVSAHSGCAAGEVAVGPLRSLKDALFIGWFGPLGAAAIFYSFLALKETGLEQPWIIGSLVICVSILIHGVTATPLAKLYNR